MRTKRTVTDTWFSQSMDSGRLHRTATVVVWDQTSMQ